MRALLGCAQSGTVVVTLLHLELGDNSHCLKCTMTGASRQACKNQSLPLAIASPCFGRPASPPCGGDVVRRGSGLCGQRGGCLPRPFRQEVCFPPWMSSLSAHSSSFVPFYLTCAPTGRDSSPPSPQKHEAQVGSRGWEEWRALEAWCS